MAKRIGLWVALVCLPVLGWAQGSCKTDVVLGRTGRPAPNISVYVCANGSSGTPCSPLTPLFSDAALSVSIANPVVTSSLGNYSFCAAPGTYMLQLKDAVAGFMTPVLVDTLVADDSTIVHRSGDETIAGTKNFTGALHLNGTNLPFCSVAGQTWVFDGSAWNCQAAAAAVTGAGIVSKFGGGSCSGYLKSDLTCDSTSYATTSSVAAKLDSSAFTGAGVVGKFNGGSCSGYLKSDGTCDTPTSLPTGGHRNDVLSLTGIGGGGTPFALWTPLFTSQGAGTELQYNNAGISSPVLNSSWDGTTLHVPALSAGDGSSSVLNITSLTVAALTALTGNTTGDYRQVSDGLTSTDCTVGGGAVVHWCRYSGSAWASMATTTPVNADWTAGSGLAQILNKPTLAQTKAAVTGQPLLSYDSSTGAFTQAALTAAQVGALPSTTVLAQSKTAATGQPLLSYDATAGTFTQGALTAAQVGAEPAITTLAKSKGGAGADMTNVTFPSTGTLTVTIGNGAQALGTTDISSGLCATVITVTATGVASTDTISADFNGDPTAITGYAPSTNGHLTIYKWPSANAVNFKVCNETSASITRSAATLNWKVTR